MTYTTLSDLIEQSGYLKKLNQNFKISKMVTKLGKYHFVPTKERYKYYDNYERKAK